MSTVSQAVVLIDPGFLDHLLREDPSKRMIAIKRSFFHNKITSRASIGGGVEAMKGVYQSIRAAQVCLIFESCSGLIQSTNISRAVNSS